MATAPPIRVDPALVERSVLELARDGACGETGVWRTVYSPEWVAATDRSASWCAEAGPRVHRDAVSNVWGRLRGPRTAPRCRSEAASVRGYGGQQDPSTA